MLVGWSGGADMQNRIHILGCPVDRISVEEILALVDRVLATGGPPLHILPVNEWTLMMTNDDQAYRELLTAFDLFVADGLGAVWAARLKGGPLPGKISFPELTDLVLDRCARDGRKVD